MVSEKRLAEASQTGSMVMQKITGVALAMSLLVNTAYAANTGALAPGVPAGVTDAQSWDVKTLAVIGGGAVLIVGFALLISDGTSSITTPINGGGTPAAVSSATTTTSTK